MSQTTIINLIETFIASTTYNVDLQMQKNTPVSMVTKYKLYIHTQHYECSSILNFSVASHSQVSKDLLTEHISAHLLSSKIVQPTVI